MRLENQPQNQFEEDKKHEAQIGISELPLGNLNSEIENLRNQIHDEYEYETVVQVFSGAFSASAGRVFVARESEKIAGIGVVSLQSKTEGTLEALYVVKDYREKGLGNSLTKAGIRYLLSIGIKKIHINITSAGARSIAHKLKEQYGDTIILNDHGDYFK